MAQTITNLIMIVKTFVLNTTPILGLLIGIGLIILESIIPVLPLALFIALNIIIFGNILGFIISWLATVCGCMVSFYIFRKGLSSRFYKHLKHDGHILKFMRKVSNISFTNLAVIAAMPFTPAFSVNIAAGLSEISPKKFLGAMLIGKIPMVYFWGFIGTSFVESINNPVILLEIFLMVVGAFIVSKIISKKFNIE